MTAPKPEVLYLPAIFRTIRAGRTRIPAFQRGLVWRQNQILELLESVYKSYPVGSLLFWHVNVNEMRTDEDTMLPFPHPEVDGIVDFVLDGMQRISALYGAFHEHREIPPKDDKFAIVFDLRHRKFLTFRDKNEYCISLRDIFSPKSLITEQARLATLEDGESLVEGTLELQRIFQEYLIPVVRIGERSAEEVVEIFERVNSTGTKLSAVDFMRALTWSSEFDLTERLEELQSAPELASCRVPTDTVAKIMALVMDTIPTSKEIISLRKKTPTELAQASVSTRQALIRVVEFLRSKLGIGSYDYIPYEGQFLVAASAASSCENLPSWLIQWFWIVGFSESLQGRPDSTIAKMALEVRTAPMKPLTEHFSLSSDTIIARPLRKGASLSMTMLAALATGPAHSVFTGEAMEPAEFMDGYQTSFVAAIFPREAVGRAIRPTPKTDKLISNVILLSESERRPAPKPEAIRQAILKLSKSKEGCNSLLSQCIDSDCIKALVRDDCQLFLHARAKALLARAKALSGGK